MHNIRPLLFWAALVACCLPLLEQTSHAGEAERDQAVVESLLRLGDEGVALAGNQPQVQTAVNRYLTSQEDAGRFLEVVAKLKIKGQTNKLTSLLDPKTANNLRVEAIRMLVDQNEAAILQDLVRGENAEVAVIVAEGLGLIGGQISREMLEPLLTEEDVVPSVRIAATSALGRSRPGQEFLLSLAEAGKLPKECHFAAADALFSSRYEPIRKGAAEHLQAVAANAGEPVPPISQLVKQRGDGKAGKEIFRVKGTCSKCHKVHGHGNEVGPDLSEIGSKLSREALFVSILNPNAGISHNYEAYSVVTLDGLVLNGILVSQTDDQVTIKTKEAVERTIKRDDIDEMVKQTISLMPDNLHQNLSVQELLDLVDYMVLLKRKDEAAFHALGSQNANESPSATARTVPMALSGIDVADGLQAVLFAAEPQLRNPSNIDIDHLGRVWVCEIVNYRHFRNPYNPVREAGDRILVMEDTDGDGKADKKTVFYQGTDINSPHGVCVLGNRVIVSAGERVIALIDNDGDLKVDETEVLFTGIGGVEHDHGIHAFVPGPDGKLYFTFGNEGHQLKDPDGNPVIDKAGNEVTDQKKPYQQGMVFRCDPDGSNVETLAWNFRNNWEPCVDSFGTVWQSDNDDDGNRATRINYVMTYGNFGYRDEQTGATWKEPRTGMHEIVSLRHWHLNDPGVVPNVLQTGAGSPTGIMKYEGTLLPQQYRNQLLHCDPGPNSVRTYQLLDYGAGYRANLLNTMTGSRDQWFRPIDVCAAPDGSLIVADWYDPGVGGHRMGDTQRGRLFRITPTGMDGYKVSPPDFSTVPGAVEALRSPNVSTRFLAGQALREMGEPAEEALLELFKSSSRQELRARALWILMSFNEEEYARLAANDENEDIRIVGVRILRQTLEKPSESPLLQKLADDPSAKVRREVALTLRYDPSEGAAEIWAKLALQHDGSDRWYLEALGIGATDNWDRCLEEWLKLVGSNWKTPGGRDIVWRSRAKNTCSLLAELINDSETDASVQLRYFRALDFHQGGQKQGALRQVVSEATATNKTSAIDRARAR